MNENNRHKLTKAHPGPFALAGGNKPIQSSPDFRQ